VSKECAPIRPGNSPQKSQKYQKRKTKQVNSVDEFSDLKSGRAEIDQQALPDASCFEVAQRLGTILIRETLAGFQFGDQLVLNEQIGEKTSKQYAVLIEHLQWTLLRDLEALFAETVGHGILVHFFQMPAAEVDMKIIACLPDHVTETQDLLIAY
jgi:hypothetical protein